jgi:hypothetical protein
MGSTRRHRTFTPAWLAALLLAAVVGVAPAFAQSTAAGQNRVVMQVSDADPGKWNLALNNVRNLQADLGASNVEIEIVAYGPGIGMLKPDSVVGNRIGEAAAASRSRLRKYDARL